MHKALIFISGQEKKDYFHDLVLGSDRWLHKHTLKEKKPACQIEPISDIKSPPKDLTPPSRKLDLTNN